VTFDWLDFIKTFAIVSVSFLLLLPYDKGMGCGWGRPRIIDLVAWLFRKVSRREVKDDDKT
jgi:hypothetical protein